MGYFRSARLAMLGVAAGCVLAGSGCADERDPINKVQLGAMPASSFLGPKLDDSSDDPEFYFRTTFVDVWAGAGSEELFTSSDAAPTTRRATSCSTPTARRSPSSTPRASRSPIQSSRAACRRSRSA